MEIYSHEDNFEKLYNYFLFYNFIINYFERYFNLDLVFVCYRTM